MTDISAFSQAQFFGSRKLIFPEAWVKLYLKYPRSTTQGANIKKTSMDSRAGMARRRMWLIRTKMFLFWKNDHHPKKIWSFDNRFEVNRPPEPTLVLCWISKFFLFGALLSDTLKIKHTKNLKEIPSRHVLENLL